MTSVIARVLAYSFGAFLACSLGGCEFTCVSFLSLYSAAFELFCYKRPKMNWGRLCLLLVCLGCLIGSGLYLTKEVSSAQAAHKAGR